MRFFRAHVGVGDADNDRLVCRWQKIANTLGSSNIPIADKHELSLSSPFVNIDKNSYLAPGQTNSYLPPVTSRESALASSCWIRNADPQDLEIAESEIAEITSLLCWKREQEPAKWRRFVIVVDQVDSVVAETAKDRGVSSSFLRRFSRFGWLLTLSFFVVPAD